MSERILIESACKSLMVGYGIHADHGNAEAFSELFAEDGVWVQGNGNEVRGRAALLRYIKERPSRGLRRHIITNTYVEAIDADNASGMAYALAFEDGAWTGNGAGKLSPASALVEYHDTFRREGGAWRFARRATVPILRA